MKYILLPLVLLLSACVSTATGTSSHALAHSDYQPYDPAADARMDVQKTLTAAKSDGKKGLLVFGANWCHDSRALAEHFAKPRFKALIDSHYSLVYVDVGQKDRNIDVANQFGVSKIVGTPTIFVTTPEGEVLNPTTAPTWRNAASRNEDDVYQYFLEYAGNQPD